MKSRTRTKTQFRAVGAVTYPTPAGPWSYQSQDWTCTDYIEKKKDEVSGLTPVSDLYLRKTELVPPLLNYRLSSLVDGVLYYNMANAPCTGSHSLSPSNPPSGWEHFEGTTSELTAKLLAGSNPFRYTISVPVMIAELVEAGSLLKLASNNFFSLVGSAHLNWLFGWEATMRDIRTLASITKAIELRIKEFNAIVEQGGSRRKVYLASGGESSPEVTMPIYSSGMGSWNGKVFSEYRTKVWGSVRWVPNRAKPIDFSKLASFNEACRVVLDLRTPDASTIWEAIPFSWLVDYFLNVGDSLQAIEDTDKVLPTDICLMRHRRIVQNTAGIQKPESDYPWRRTNSITAGRITYDVKIRSVVTPSSVGDLLSFGFMSQRQATNLIALLLSLSRFR